MSNFTSLPHLACVSHFLKRSYLTLLYRYAFTVLANLSVFTIMFFVLNTGMESSSGGGGGVYNETLCGNDTSMDSTIGCFSTPTEEPSGVDQIGPEDAENFRVRSG